MDLRTGKMDCRTGEGVWTFMVISDILDVNWLALFAAPCGGGIEKRAGKLELRISEGADMIGAKRFSGDSGAEERMAWVESLS